ncbi:Ger(x)C family spore germination protein [Bacillus sp. CGMCC 1.16607]|uniref:Ger(x)C family spore germination protein n=1 Tax=Bacillus sp. CGMCC 1.16607 TaxID=3351842 RepID=UPI0036332A2B
MKRIFIFPFFIAVFLLTGCWDSLEINDAAIITGIAIEKGENALYKMTVSTVNATELSKSSATGNTPSTTFSLEGDSISELSNKMNIGLTRKNIYSHTRILVISEKIAKEGMLEFLDFLERSGEFRNDFNIMVSKGVKASDILKVAYPLQKDPSLKLHKQAQSFLDYWGGDPKVRLTDFITALVVEGRHPVAAVVTIKGDAKKGQSVENNKMLDLDAMVIMDGMAVFNNDKLVGMMSVEDVRSYLWTEDLKSTSLSVPCGKLDDKTLYNDIRIISTSTKKVTKYKSGRAELIIKVTGEADLVGTHCKEALDKPETFDKYEKQTNRFIESEIEGTIRKVQEEYNVDIFGFGESLNRSNHKVFQKIKSDWDQYFSNADVKVESTIYIRRSGIRGNSFIRDLDKLKESQNDTEE